MSITFIIIILLLLFAAIFAYLNHRFFISIILFCCFMFSSLLLSLFALNNSTFLPVTLQFIILVVTYVIIPITVIYICIRLIYNTHVMASKEGRNLVGKLSAFFGLNVLFIITLSIIQIVISKAVPLPLSILFAILIVLDIVFIGLFVCYLFCSALYQLTPYRKIPDYIIVLGAGITSEEVTPLLQARLDKGLEYYHKNPQAKIIVSGGQGPDEPVSEAFAMAKYLRQKQIPDNQIILEDNSTSTFENMAFSKEKITADWQESRKPNVIFATNNYHVLRSMLYAQQAKLHADGVGSPVSSYFLPTALIREFIALLVAYKWLTGLIILVVMIFIILSYSSVNF